MIWYDMICLFGWCLFQSLKFFLRLFIFVFWVLYGLCFSSFCFWENETVFNSWVDFDYVCLFFFSHSLFQFRYDWNLSWVFCENWRNVRTRSFWSNLLILMHQIVCFGKLTCFIFLLNILDFYALLFSLNLSANNEECYLSGKSICIWSFMFLFCVRRLIL